MLATLIRSAFLATREGGALFPAPVSYPVKSERG
jgi:hypothetical protein